MSKSEYAIRMARLSNRIFGNIITKTDDKSMKVYKIFCNLPAHKNQHYVNYYPPMKEIARLTEKLRNEGLYRDEHADMLEVMEARRRERGMEKKVPYHVQKRLEKEQKLKEKREKKEFD